MPQIPPIEKIYARLLVAESKNVELEARVAKLEKPVRKKKSTTS